MAVDADFERWVFTHQAHKVVEFDERRRLEFVFVDVEKNIFQDYRGIFSSGCKGMSMLYVESGALFFSGKLSEKNR